MTVEEALKKYGGLCPRCGEQVRSKNELWYCDACGRGGNAYRYLADQEGLNYLAAYKKYGDREFDK